MATKYQMQALSVTAVVDGITTAGDGALYTWLADTPDFAGASFPGPGAPQDIAIASSQKIDGSSGPMPPLLHDLTYGPLGLWQMGSLSYDGGGNTFVDLTDSTTNHYDLVAVANAQNLGQLYPGVLGVQGQQGAIGACTHNANTGGPAGLHITGDMTIELLFRGNDGVFGGSSYASLVGYMLRGGYNWSTSADNVSYELFLSSPNNVLIWRQQSGSSTSYAQWAAYGLSVPMNSLVHIAATRSAGVIQLYVNGLPWGRASTALTPPDGGANCQFIVGDYGRSPNGVVGSVKVIAAALTAAQIKAEFNRTLGPVYGLAP